MSAISEKIAQLEADNRRLRKGRCEADCRYTMGNIADSGGSHCPWENPCDRCSYERDIERLEAQLTVMREALEPFATEAENYDYGDGSGPDLHDAPDESSLNEFNDLTVGHLRKARAALSQEPKS